MLSIQYKGSSLDSIRGLDKNVSLIATGDGTEVMHHHLVHGTYWTLRPEVGWQAFEHLYVLSGRLRIVSSEKREVLQAGDSFCASPVTDYVVFVAEGDTDFLYITSRPVFYDYSRMLADLRNLAVSVEQKDGYTAEHCFRIMNLSMKVAAKLQVTPRVLHDLQLGSFLHDIGKVRIPDDILNKPGKLSAEEWTIMKCHPMYSAEMIRKTGFEFLDGAAEITLQHHERYDGSGYPNGLKADEIHIGAAIIAVVDSFDAMTSNRVYQKARSKEDAMEEIMIYRGSLYHPSVVDAFIRIMNEEPDSIHVLT